MQPTKRETPTEIIRRVTSAEGDDLSNMFRAGWFGAWRDTYTHEGAPAEYVVLASPADGQLDIHHITLAEACPSLVSGSMYEAVYGAATMYGSLFLRDEQIVAGESLVAGVAEIYHPHSGYIPHTQGSSFDWRRSFSSSLDRCFRMEVA